MAFTERYANFDLATGANDGSSEADAWQTPAAVIAAVAAGDRVNIKKQASPYSLAASVVFNVAGTLADPIHYRAYETTIGDGGLWEVEYTGSLNNLQFTGAYNIVEGIDWRPGASPSLNSFKVDGDRSIALRCHLELNDNATLSNAAHCWVCLDNGGARISITGSVSRDTFIEECFFKRIGSSGAAVGLVYMDTFNASLRVRGCVIDGGGHANAGLYLHRPANSRGIGISDLVVYDAGQGVEMLNEATGSNARAVVERCIFDTIANYGVYLASGTPSGNTRVRSNAYHACTSGLTNLGYASLFDNIALSASPFVDAATGDFEINSTAGGGALLRDAEFYMDPAASSGTKSRPFGPWRLDVAGGGGGASTHAFFG